MKQIIRAFSLGLLISSATLITIYYTIGFSSGEPESMSQEEMKEQLKKQGLRVITETEYISLQYQQDKEKNKNNNSIKENPVKQEIPTEQENKKTEKPKKQAESNSNKDDKENKSFTIQIASGMKTSEISEMLADNGIIKDSFKFDQYLEKNGYAAKIQIGKYRLSSDMNQEEIAKEITK